MVGRGWVPTGELRNGDELVGEHEESLFVESARINKEEADHYNFEVEDWHTYFVGEAGKGLGPAVWVHNDCEFVTLYHGTNEEGALSILKNGVSGNFSRRNQDFGSGFYMTTDLKQAETWANQFKNGIVLEFNIPRATYDQFNIRVFDEQSIDAWREFTGAHRRGTASTDYFFHMEEDWTRYDGFSGPMVRNPIQVEKEFAIPVPIGQQTHFRSPDVLKILGCYLNTESAAVKRLRGL